MLSDRRQIVLRVLIEEYVARALPVGSRTLVERYNLGISSATVRNELSVLEEAGYLIQPHTSAGRIPTDYGYRAFVDDLLEHIGESDEDEKVIGDLKESAHELDELIEKTSKALTRLTDCLTLVIPPRVLSVEIKLVNLVSLTPMRILLVIVTRDGQVFNRQIDLSETCTQEALTRVQDTLNALFADRSLDTVISSIPEHRLIDDPLLGLIVEELVSCCREQSECRPYSLGMTRLLSQPEFSDSTRLLPVLEQLEDDSLLLHVFEEAVRCDGPLVRIGHENETEALSGVSLVASRFGEADHMGLVAIVGPTRMNYSQVFKAVRAARNILQEC